MIPRASKRLLWIGSLIGVGTCVIALFASSRGLNWVGRTDVNVQFMVTDADTGLPVSNATIHIRAEAGGFCEDRKSRKFSVTTDRDGFATRTCKQCMCFGSDGVFADTFGIHLPHWWYHASASGYTQSDPAFLDMPANQGLVLRDSRGTTISLSLRLRKSAA